MGIGWRAMASTAGARAARGGAGRGAGARAGTGAEVAPALLGAGAFFVCDVWGAIPKADLAGMEHPMFSLSTRPDRRILRYEHAGAAIEVVPSVKGLATIHDRDVLIYCVSQLMAAINAGREVGRTLKLRAHDLLVATGRETSGDAYRRLREAFERLAGTRVTTDIATGPRDARVRETTGFGMIDGWRIVRRSGPGGGERMDYVTVTLSDWLFRSVLARAVLTLDRAYFDLRKPIERRVYELARKHCGRQPEWRVSIPVLHLKSGSASPRRVFRRMMRDMIKAQPLPGYWLAEEEGDVVAVTPRGARAPSAIRSAGAPAGEAAGPDAAGQGAPGPSGTLPPGTGPSETGPSGTGPSGAPPGSAPPPRTSPLGSRPLGSRPLGSRPLLPASALAGARGIAPGRDVHALEAEWLAFWEETGRRPLRDPSAAFLGWVRRRAAP